MLFTFRLDRVNTAFTDFFTVGHVLFGYIGYLIGYIIILAMYSGNLALAVGMGIVISITVGLVWEFFENFYLFRKGLKFGKRKDSLANSLTDILFVELGAIIASILSVILTDFYLISIVIIGCLLILEEVLKRITYKVSRKYEPK